jgi:hypothetical protein
MPFKPTMRTESKAPELMKYTFPAWSAAMCTGKISACVALPSSPELPPTPLPAIVVTMPCLAQQTDTLSRTGAVGGSSVEGNGIEDLAVNAE